MNKLPIIAASTIVAAFLVGVALPVESLPAAHVVIRTFMFTPTNVDVDDDLVAPRVVWTNADLANHRPHADDGCFDAGVVGPGMTTTASMANCGTGVIAYHCHIHPGMLGTITVL